jgi:hypothetical protein
MVDDKFIDGFIVGAEKVSPGKNLYIFTFNQPARYVKSTKGIYASYGSPELKRIVGGVTVNDRLYVHWFSENVMSVVDEIGPRVPVYLFFWGGDFVEQSKDLRNFNFDALTKKYIKGKEFTETLYRIVSPLTYARLIRNYFLGRTKKFNSEFLVRKSFLNRLNYFCHWNKLDFAVICRVYGCAPIFLDFFYNVDLEKIENDLGNREYDRAGLTIWLGNSATDTNNHLEALEVLARFKNDNLKVLCPLSYGDTKYGNFVSRRGNMVFKNKWVGLRDFIPWEQYLELLRGVDVAVMYHNRTQAASNVVWFIKMGKKVYLKEQSTIYQLMRSHDIIVFAADTIKDITFAEFSRPLTASQIQSNILKISNLFSEERRLKCLSDILN